jgi:hypothetical protein
MRSVLLALLFGPLATQDRPLPDYETFAAQVETRLATDDERQSGYAFLERHVRGRRPADLLLPGRWVGG